MIEKAPSSYKDASQTLREICYDIPQLTEKELPILQDIFDNIFRISKEKLQLANGTGPEIRSSHVRTNDSIMQIQLKFLGAIETKLGISSGALFGKTVQYIIKKIQTSTSDAAKVKARRSAIKYILLVVLALGVGVASNGISCGGSNSTGEQNTEIIDK